MTVWWTSLTLLGQIFAIMAIPATIILVLQTVLLMFGLGGGHDADAGGLEAGHDFDVHTGDHDAGGDHDMHDGHGHEGGDAAGLRLFTVRGFVAFFSIGGWAGIASLDYGAPPMLSVAIAVIGGLAAMLLTALIIKWSLKLQSSGNIDMQNATGKTGEVYTPIPPNMQGRGKVFVTVQERFVDVDAVTDSDEKLPTGARVTVKSVTPDNVLVVEAIK